MPLTLIRSRYFWKSSFYPHYGASFCMVCSPPFQAKLVPNGWEKGLSQAIEGDTRQRTIKMIKAKESLRREILKYMGRKIKCIQQQSLTRKILKMNKENLKKLVELIKSSKTFTMRDFSKRAHDCESPACIMGHASSLMGNNEIRCHSVEKIGGFLGLTVSQASEVYAPYYYYADCESRIWNKGYISKAHAIRMLEKLIETGEVDWKGTRGSLKSWVAKKIFAKKTESRKEQKFDMKAWLEQIKPEETEEKEKELERADA